MRIVLLFSLFVLSTFKISAQTNFVFSNPAVPAILKAQYSPATYGSSKAVVSKQGMVTALLSGINKDSLLANLLKLATFQNRNTASDTLSATFGIGAARKWAFQQFQQYSSRNENRLLVSYFQFDQDICGMGRHKNVLAVLPGTDTSKKDIVLVEAHIDSRCEDPCDTLCLAQGMEDNASGTAMVLELARVMSGFATPRTIVFVLTTGEEQGLYGANALSLYFKNNNINLLGVINNDIVGGIICGKTSSAPGCPGENELDSVDVRIFSNAINFSADKGLARYIKLEFTDEMQSLLEIPTRVNLMNPVDRTGRGGDHIPFKNQGYPAVRLTSAYEHGDANPVTGYSDRQHSTRDILGKDTNGDGIIDSFFVNVSYLRRNTLLNGTAICMMAKSPDVPAFDLVNDGNGLSVIITKPIGSNRYRVGFRNRNNDFDTLIAIEGRTDLKTYHVKKDSVYFVSVASVDNENIESLFAIEKYVKVAGVPAAGLSVVIPNKLTLLPISPNPVDEQLAISILAEHLNGTSHAVIEIRNLQGQLVQQSSLDLIEGMNELVFPCAFPAHGIYTCSVMLPSHAITTRKFVF